MTTLPIPVEDRIAIGDRIAALSLYGDLEQWDRVADGLMPEVTTDYTSLLGGAVQTQTREALIAGYRALLPGFDMVQHMVTTMAVTLHDAAHAGAVSQVRATHRLGDALWVVAGRYEHTLVRTADGWRASAIRFVMAYEEGDRALVGQAAARVAARS